MSRESTPPVACTLDPASLAARRAGLLGELMQAAKAGKALPTGFRFEFDASAAALDLIRRAIDAERQCCRFLTFTLTVPPDLAAFVLDLTGPEGTREFLSELLADADRADST